MMNINDFTPITPETLLRRTDAELIYITGLDFGNKPHWRGWASDELQRRQMRLLHEIMLSLNEATLQVNENVLQMTKTSLAANDVTISLLSATREVRGEIQTLASSSDRLESLTVKLNRLTWALVWLTIGVIAVTIGIEVWHVSREINAPVAPIVIQHLLPPAPQTPPVPAH